MSVPIANPEMEVGELSRVLEALHRGQLADGPTVREFEREFAEYCGASEGIATSNGTTALHAALRGLEIGAGDRVLTTPFSFVASANAIRLCGATPVFADVDPETFNLDPAAVRETIDRCDGDVDAILAVHLYGLPAPMDELAEVADRYDCMLVEDAAQAHGAAIDDRRVGTFGDAACFSFYPTKNMTTGEGGMVLTDDADVAKRVESYVNHGRTESGSSYEHASVGHNYRMTSLAAGIGRRQLERLPGYVDTRRENAKAYTQRLRHADAPIEPPIEPAGTTHVYHQYTVRTPHRDALREYLDDNGIGAGVYYPSPIHEQPAYADVDADAPVAERLADEVLSVPVHPELTRSEVNRIGDLLVEFEA